MFARAGDESYKTAEDEDGQRPLHLCAVIARPENDKGDSGGRGNGSKSEPSSGESRAKGDVDVSAGGSFAGCDGRRVACKNENVAAGTAASTVHKPYCCSRR